jgi:BsuBI/PstI restriction endonuclease domain/BsuBI/PstI restriction endonuclease HTH domain
MPESHAKASLPPLVSVDDVQRRLEALFPDAFPDRSILVGRMAAHVVFVFLYGGFIEHSGRLLRPSVVYFFTAEQARKIQSADRLAWLASAFKPGYRPTGKRWYADNSRESIRDDLMRSRLLVMGIIGRKEGVATTSSAPVYFLRAAFAALFDPALSGAALLTAIDTWRATHLASSTLKRMALKAQGALARQGDVLIEMPDGTRMRVSAGPSSPILQAMVEEFAPRWLQKPVVLWISASDRKTHPQFVQLAASVGLAFYTSNELPDLILADLADPVRFLFCEIVATDGPVTAERKAALTAIASRSGIDPEQLHFVTAFQDREAAAFRKTFSRIAPDSDVWFSTEPDLIVELRKAKPKR